MIKKSERNKLKWPVDRGLKSGVTSCNFPEEKNLAGWWETWCCRGHGVDTYRWRLRMPYQQVKGIRIGHKKPECSVFFFLYMMYYFHSIVSACPFLQSLNLLYGQYMSHRWSPPCSYAREDYRHSSTYTRMFGLLRACSGVCSRISVLRISLYSSTTYLLNANKLIWLRFYTLSNLVCRLLASRETLKKHRTGESEHRSNGSWRLRCRSLNDDHETRKRS